MVKDNNTTVISTGKETADDSLKTVEETGKSAWQGVSKLASNLATTITDLASDTYNTSSKAFSGTYDTASNLVGNAGSMLGVSKDKSDENHMSSNTFQERKHFLEKELSGK